MNKNTFKKLIKSAAVGVASLALFVPMAMNSNNNAHADYIVPHTFTTYCKGVGKCTIPKGTDPEKMLWMQYEQNVPFDGAEQTVSIFPLLRRTEAWKKCVALHKYNERFMSTVRHDNANHYAGYRHKHYRKPIRKHYRKVTRKRGRHRIRKHYRKRGRRMRRKRGRRIIHRRKRGRRRR